MNRTHCLWTTALLLCLLTTACSRQMELAEREKSERASQLFSNAMDDLKSGRSEAAMSGFSKVIRYEPNSYSAHFQLATLLQDIKKDYVGAISHYQLYLDLRPESDKATLAKDRMDRCRAMFEAEIMSKAGASDAVRAELKKVGKERDILARRVKELEAEVAKSATEIAGLKKECEGQSNIIRKLSETDVGGGPRSVKDALAEFKAKDSEKRRRAIKPTDAELLDDDEETKPATVAANAKDVKKFREEMEREEREDSRKAAAKPVAKRASAEGDKPAGGLDAVLGGKKKKASGDAMARPETYLVQEGDTLFRVSTRFYGTQTMWRKIRDANRGVISTDGRLRAGDTIKLP